MVNNFKIKIQNGALYQNYGSANALYAIPHGTNFWQGKTLVNLAK